MTCYLFFSMWLCYCNNVCDSFFLYKVVGSGPLAIHICHNTYLGTVSMLRVYIQQFHSSGSERASHILFIDYSTILALPHQGLTYKGFMKFHPSNFLVSTVLKSKSSRTLNVMGRAFLVLSRHNLALSFNASSSASGGSWVNSK